MSQLKPPGCSPGPSGSLEHSQPSPPQTITKDIMDTYRKNNKGRKDIAGESFHLMKVLHYHGTKGKKGMWLCECACGNFKTVDGRALRSGRVKSCGCLSKPHGMFGTRIHRIWKNVMGRALWTNKDGYNHKRYKGRGISVCEEWRTFVPFYEWAMANGYRDDLTIDRIDNNKGYSPENCRWATRKEQSNNLSTNKLITFEGRTQTQTQWEEEKNLPKGTLHNRVNKCRWSIGEALNTPATRQRKPEPPQKQSYSWLSYAGKIESSEVV